MTVHRVFRDTYDGEFIIHQIDIQDGEAQEDREWIPNSVTVDHSSDIAVVFGNGYSRDGFNLNLIKNHKGSHLGKKKLATYGCNAFYRDYSPDHLVVSSKEMAEEVILAGYQANNIVHASTSILMTYPGQLHLVPYGTQLNAGSVATFLAAFDGFKTVFLMGFDNQQAEGINDNIYAGTENYNDLKTHIHDDKWITWMAEIFNAYYDVQFLRVNKGPNPYTPEAWKYCTNFKNITEREFVTTADL